MNYGELRTHFLELLNRNDCTDNLADRFLSMGLRRTERLLRTPIQRTVLSKTLDNTWTGLEPIPSDYLGVQSIGVNGVPVPRITDSQIASRAGFRIHNSNFEFFPSLEEGDVLRIEYYSEFLKGVADDAVTDYSAVLTDIAVYGGLIYAADYFLMEHKPSWEATYQSLIQETQLMADIDETWGSLAITPVGGGIA